MIFLSSQINCFVCLPAEEIVEKRTHWSARSWNTGRSAVQEDMPRKPGAKGQGANYGHPNGKVNKPRKDCAAQQLAWIWHLPAPGTGVRTQEFGRQGLWQRQLAWRVLYLDVEVGAVILQLPEVLQGQRNTGIGPAL
jgi:hypothetical protein